MRIPPPTSTRLVTAGRRGDHLVLLAEGDAGIAELAANPDTVDLAGEVACLLGGVHAAQERFAVGASYLEYGLTALEASRDDGGAPSPTDDWYALVLLDLLLRLGRYDDALGRITSLLEPDRGLDTRFAATRAQASIAAARGDYETAHFLLNTATGLALRIRNRFRSALVDGDRAILLATQGRLYEGIGLADRVLTSFVRPPIGDYQHWGNAEGAAIALSISRAAANTGDQLTAQRMLIQGTTAAERVGTGYVKAQLDLTRGVFWSTERKADAAEAALLEAQHAFNLLGCAPAVATATLEQGRLAQRRGLYLSAEPLFRRAFDEFRAIGHAREMGEIRRLLAQLPPQSSAS